MGDKYTRDVVTSAYQKSRKISGILHLLHFLTITESESSEDSQRMKTYGDLLFETVPNSRKELVVPKDPLILHDGLSEVLKAFVDFNVGGPDGIKNSSQTTIRKIDREKGKIDFEAILDGLSIALKPNYSSSNVLSILKRVSVGIL